MTTAKHTALPWAVEIFPGVTGAVITADKGCTQVANCADADDAALIVQAVNNYDAALARVKALEGALKNGIALLENEGCEYDDVRTYLEVARAALSGANWLTNENVRLAGELTAAQQRIAELERGEILTGKELLSAVITAVMSGKQADRDEACRKLQYHIIAVETERDAREAECESKSEMYEQQVEYSIKLQRLIEAFCRDDSELPYPRLHHHKLLMRRRAQLAEAQAKLERACEVIEWKSLYCKAEMGWYAEALVAEIRGEPEPEFAFNGRNWYRNYRAAIDAAKGAP